MCFSPDAAFGLLALGHDVDPGVAFRLIRARRFVFSLHLGEDAHGDVDVYECGVAGSSGQSSF